MKITCPNWLTKCDAADIDEAYEEATVDCYGDEQAAGLVDMVIQELCVPFAADVLGQRVEVVDAAPARNAAWGVDLIAKSARSDFQFPPHQSNSVSPFPKAISISLHCWFGIPRYDCGSTANVSESQVQINSSEWRISLTVCVKPCSLKQPRYFSAERGGFLNRARWILTAVSTTLDAKSS